MILEWDERPLGEPFWMLDTASEVRAVRGILQRRFPELYGILTQSLEEADPLEVVYPENPGEYDDVVREIIVLLASVSGDISALSFGQLEQIVREGLARCFGEEPDEPKVGRAVSLIATKASVDNGSGGAPGGGADDARG